MTVLATWEGRYWKHEATNAGTRYVIHATKLNNGAVLCAVESGWGGNYGEWILLGSDFGSDSVAWNYLAEKMPIMGKHDGDKPGWIKAFATVGIEVFG